MRNFSDFVIDQFGRLQNKFRQKHTQYKGSDADELANFRVGARLKRWTSGNVRDGERLLPEAYRLHRIPPY